MTIKLSPPVGPGGYPVKLQTAAGADMTVVLDATHPGSSRRLWGMTLLERNLRLVERLGATSVNIVVPEGEDHIWASRRRFRGLVEPSIESATLLTWKLVAQRVEAAPGPVLLLEAHGVYDRRLVSLLWQAPAPVSGERLNGEPLEAAALLVDKGTLGAVITDPQSSWSSATSGLSSTALGACLRHVVDFRNWGSLHRFSFPVMVLDLLGNVLTRLDIWMILYFLGATESGLYAIARRAASATLKVPQSFDPTFSARSSAISRSEGNMAS